MIATLTLLASFLPPATVADVPSAKDSAATPLAVKLCLQQIELVAKQTLYQVGHPVLKQQRRHVRALERTLQTMVDEGGRVDEKYVQATLDGLLRQAQAELDIARQDLTDSHPQLPLLELRLQAIKHVAVLRK